MNAMKFCPAHGKASTLRTIVHEKGCPGAKTDCVDTCYPRTWFYCTRCDWRRRIEPLKGVRETEGLREVARTGRKIWRLRREAGLTSMQLAKLAGVSLALIGFIEKGQTWSRKCGSLIRILEEAKRTKRTRNAAKPQPVPNSSLNEALQSSKAGWDDEACEPEDRGAQLARCSRGVKFNLRDNYAPTLNGVFESDWLQPRYAKRGMPA